MRARRWHVSLINKIVIKLEQGGKTLQAGTNFKDFKVDEIEGLSGLEFDFQMTNNPQSPNAIITNKKPLPRQINIRIYCKGDLRQFSNGFFNPFTKGKLTVTWGETTRWIEYYPHPVKIVQSTIYQNLEMHITLICPEPYFKSMDDYGKNIANKRSLLAFPFVMLPDRGLISDYRIFNTKVKIQNDGDIEVGAKIIFTAVGFIKNPKLIINDGEFVRAIIDMNKGDSVAFNTDIDNLSAMMNKEDILNQTDPKMSFFQVPPGENVIEYSSDEGTSNMQVYVFYTPQYLGI